MNIETIEALKAMYYDDICRVLTNYEQAGCRWEKEVSIDEMYHLLVDLQNDLCD